MRARSVTLSVASAFVVTAAAGAAHAGIAWGDASLHGDEVRVELDGAAHATITHVVTVHVAAKKFRAFALDGVDDGVQAPADEQTIAAMDGPGWPISIVDDKGGAFDGFVEPAKEPRRLRVHLGQDGVPRGEYVITLKYRVDLSSKVRREGPNAFLTWSAPTWPEGYDNGRIVFVLPTAPNEPRVSLVDGAGGEPRSIEGAALLDLQRKATVDELTLVRPHVPHHDDVQWVLSFDPKAMPEATAKVPTIDATATKPPARTTSLRWDLVGAIAAALGLLGAGMIARRDRDATRIGPFSPLVPLGTVVRAPLFGALVAAGLVACAIGRGRWGAVSLVAAMIVSTLRAPAPSASVSTAGRWLAMPSTAVPKHARVVGAPFDPGTWLGALVLLACVAGVGIAVAVTWRLHPDVAAIVVMHAVAMLFPFATGRSSQRAPDLVRDAWPKLRPIARLLDRAFVGRVRVVGHVPRGGSLDEVRVRVAPTDAAREAGVLEVEIGCAIVAGLGGTTLVPQMLVRMKGGSSAERAFVRRLSGARASATFAFADGRAAGERTLAVRPALVSPMALRRWIDWIFQVSVRSPDRAASASTGAPTRAAAAFAATL